MSQETDFSEWIGRVETAPADRLTPRLLAQFRAALAPHLAETGHPPAGIHWCLAPPAVEAAGLGPDGHPAKGSFLPPVPLPRRMWAGGELEFLDPLREGDEVTRTSRIGDIRSTTGRSGSLYFVSVFHEHATERGTAIREQQDIVYRAPATYMADATLPDAREDAEAEWKIAVDPVLLFRYSALTFNGHRIHYDEPYARDVEFYPSLVIHGPLQATLLLNLAISQGGGMPRKFAFRSASSACGPQVIKALAWRRSEGFDLATVTSLGVTAMKAVATW